MGDIIEILSDVYLLTHIMGTKETLNYTESDIQRLTYINDFINRINIHGFKQMI